MRELKKFAQTTAEAEAATEAKRAQTERNTREEQYLRGEALESAIADCHGLPITFGNMSATESDIFNALIQEATGAHDVYIGATVDVRRRWTGGYIREKWTPGHAADARWSRMHVLAVCYGIRGHEMETRLILFGKERFPHKLRNKSMKSSGLGSEINFMYVCRD